MYSSKTFQHVLPLIDNKLPILGDTLPYAAVKCKIRFQYTRESIVYSRLLSLVLVTTLGLLGTELKVLSSLEGKLLLGLAFLAFQTENDLSGGLGLLVEYGLGLTTEAHLLGVVSALALGEVGGLAGLVLGDLVRLVLLALLAGAVGLALLRYVHHLCQIFK